MGRNTNVTKMSLKHVWRKERQNECLMDLKKREKT